MTDKRLISNQKKLADTVSFVEDLVWLIQAKGRKADISFLREVLSDYDKILQAQAHLSAPARKIVRGYALNDPDKYFLVGVLPRLLQNESLFPSNKDIWEFAEQVLSLEIPRYEKRSRYELIGLIVCGVADLTDIALKNLTFQLNKLLENESLISEIAEQKASNGYFSWNEVIQRLGK